jgi:replicative DNA helicase
LTDASDFMMADAVPEPPPDDNPAPLSDDRRRVKTLDSSVDAVMPCNVEAEKVVLAAILLDNAAFSEAAERLEAEDFSLDSHRRIFLRMSELVDANQAVDIVTLVDELSRHKEVEAVGGVAYIASITEGVPRRPAITEYIAILKDKSTLRKLMGICSLAIARAADQSETAMEVLEAAESQLLEIAQDANTGKLRTIYQSVEDAGGTEPYLKAYTQPELKPGLQTGFLDYDRMTGGLQKSELTIWAARPSMGKALKLNCKIKTVDGWKLNRDIQVGDELASVDGSPSRVTGVFPQGERQFYRVSFADGRWLDCDGEHQWLVYYRTWDKPRVLTTSQMIEKLSRKRYKNRLWIDAVSGDFGVDEGLPLHPWVLGVLLGNGCMVEGKGCVGFSSVDRWTIDRLRSLLPAGCELVHSDRCDYRIRGKDERGANILKGILGNLNLFGCRSEHKRVPAEYLLARKSARLELLRGLMDTDGNVEKTGSLVYSTSSAQLSIDVQQIARSLGALASFGTREKPKYTYKGGTRTGLPAYRVYISHPNSANFVSLPRKKDRIKKPMRQSRLTFQSVESVDAAEAQCISVSHPSQLYIATESYIVTHNTAIAMNLIENVCCGTNRVVAFFSLEMSREAIERRFMAARARVNVKRAMEGFFLSGDEKWKLEQALGDLVESGIFIDDSSSLTPVQMRAKARRLKQREKRLDLVACDYLQLLSAGTKTGNRQEEIALISRSLKAMAKELECPVVALAQLNRSPDQRQDKRPVLSDLRESGQIEQDGDVIGFLHRGSYYDRDNEDLKGLAEFIIGKSRNGPTGVVKLAFDETITRFDNLARS